MCSIQPHGSRGAPERRPVLGIKGFFISLDYFVLKLENLGDSPAKRLAVRKSVSHKNPFMDFLNLLLFSLSPILD